MEKIIHSESVKASLTELGWSQKALAEKIGVSPQSVTNWLQGVDFPRPDKLLKLATNLGLSFEKLVVLKEAQPVVAFRRKGGSITTEQHLLNASSMGSLLRPLVSYLPTTKVLRTQIQSPSLDYEKLQIAAAAVRAKIGIGAQAALQYQQLINEFNENGAVIIPVMWGNKQNHGNALHILLPENDVTFIYLNLDTYLEDFKFWMAHELAHVYTPDLAGKDEGEDFADAFAGALLFPKELAQLAYAATTQTSSKSGEIAILRKFAHEHQISLFSVFCEVKKYAKAANLPPLTSIDTDIHAIRSMVRGDLVSLALFSPEAPSASAYIAASHSVFQSSFFHSLKRMLKELGTGSGYVQQLLDISVKDATALHTELMN
jgi:transcriptional regulator with XRE-family HTH domain